MKKATLTKSLYQNQSLIIVMVVFVLLSLMTVGFAAFGSTVSVGGFVTVVPPGRNGNIHINSADYVSNNRVTTRPTVNYNGLTINITNTTFSGAGNIVYNVQVVNDSRYTYVYEGYDFSNTTNTTRATYNLNVQTPLALNDLFKPGFSTNFRLTLTTNRQSKDSAVVTFKFGESQEGSLMGALLSSTIDLQSGNKKELSLMLKNSYEYARPFTLEIGNDSFILVDENDEELESFSAPNGVNSYTVYIKPKPGVIFLNDTIEVPVYVCPQDLGKMNIGAVSLKVFIDEDYVDDVIPEVDNVALSQDNNGIVSISWNRLDEGGTAITNYVIKIYNNSNTLVSTYNTLNGNESYTLSDSLADGTYYATVYGVDEAGNSGESYETTLYNAIKNGTTLPTDHYAAASSKKEIRNTFSVTTGELDNTNFNGASTAAIGSTYTGTFSNYTATSVTVTMGGVELTTDNTQSSYYTYNNGNLTVYNVQGDLVISGTGCLVEGTLIRLASGKLKKVEDITYDDLLLVWDYEHGQFTYEYPIWIEKKGVSKEYQLTKFDDGSSLKTVTYHGIYSFDEKAFVNIDNPEKFKVGTTVLKLDYQNGNPYLKQVKVKSIENVQTTVNYYEIVSTTYYNVLANDFLTTDGLVELVNMYGFDENAIWQNPRETNTFEYEEVESALPYYLFKGLRADEVKYFINKGIIGIDKLDYLKNSIISINSNMLLPVRENSKGNRMWMVSTSTNEKGLYEEGSIYKLPKIDDNNFVGWYNTATGKVYQSGEEYKVIYGTHFIAKYKQN